MSQVQPCVCAIYTVYGIKCHLLYFEAYAKLHFWSPLVSPHDTWHSSVLFNILAWSCSIELWGVCISHTLVYTLTKVYTNDTCHWYAQEYLLLHFEVLNYGIISSIPMCYTKCHNVYIFHFHKLLMLMKSIILAISWHDTLWPLGIKFRPVAKCMWHLIL